MLHKVLVPFPFVTHSMYVVFYKVLIYGKIGEIKVQGKLYLFLGGRDHLYKKDWSRYLPDQ